MDKGDKRKKQLLQVALDVFIEKGYYGTSTREIARRAGVSSGLLFHYCAIPCIEPKIATHNAWEFPARNSPRRCPSKMIGIHFTILAIKKVFILN